ncbi:uncharacterized protein LOC107718468 [Sinocyclocheilus rhinocerous]|uniref:uncharacterized protein LOC107718468 n=1 Tax=Sinocyclocheilus rhinocerous TaxID=307959 RepID=UPI0007B8A6E8|nr:PREDICTED: uncharacterized protein LOC107718468 [Sinocyclocheilus rhinocerous]
MGAVVYYCYNKCAKAKEKNDQTPMEQAIPLNNGRVLGEEADNPNNVVEEIAYQQRDLPDGQEERGPLIDGRVLGEEADNPNNGQEECDPQQDMFHSEPDQLKKITVKQGETVTLKTGVTDMQRDDLLRWKYADSRVSESTTLFSVIAVCNKRTARIAVKEGPGGKFKDRLQLDHQTGNLTIKNMRVKDTGHFKLEIKNNKHQLTKTIKVNVCASTKKQGDDPNETNLCLIPEEDPNNTSTYTVEPMDTADEATDEELS